MRRIAVPIDFPYRCLKFASSHWPRPRGRRSCGGTKRRVGPTEARALAPPGPLRPWRTGADLDLADLVDPHGVGVAVVLGEHVLGAGSDDAKAHSASLGLQRPSPAASSVESTRNTASEPLGVTPMKISSGEFWLGSMSSFSMPLMCRVRPLAREGQVDHVLVGLGRRGGAATGVRRATRGPARRRRRCRRRCCLCRSRRLSPGSRSLARSGVVPRGVVVLLDGALRRLERVTRVEHAQGRAVTRRRPRRA